MGGDFNEILYASDRKGCTRLNAHSDRFHNWISDFSLLDWPMTNLRHTWSNFRINASCSKIDRIFVSKEGLDLNPKVYLKGLPRPVSDHCSLFIATEGPQGGPTPFRFEKMWLQHKTFKDSILSWWHQTQVNGWAAFKLQKK